MTKEEFIGMAVNDLLNHEYSIKLIQDKKVEGFGGWFDASQKELVVAIKSSVGFDTFIHEYCHFRQSVDDPDFYKKYEYSYDSFMKNFSYETMKNSVILEHDCESRSLKLIEKYGLPVDTTHYIKCANAYLFSYHLTLQNKRWPSKGIYYKSILKYCPEQLEDVDFYFDIKNISPKLISKMNKICFTNELS